MTKKEMYTKHQELWYWLADNPEKDKVDWPGWKEYGYAENYCFACQWVTDQDVECCPLAWPSAAGTCTCDESLFIEWLIEKEDFAHRALLADLIANVPLRKGRKRTS